LRQSRARRPTAGCNRQIIVFTPLDAGMRVKLEASIRKYEKVAETLADLQSRGLKKIGFINNDLF
jgi:hypothetical protein